MRQLKRNLFLLAALVAVPFAGFSQEDAEEEEEFQYDDYDYEESTIRTLTPSKLIALGQVDIKWFNNLFTSTTFVDGNGDDFGIPRETFFTSTLEVFFGISENKKFNLGLISVSYTHLTLPTIYSV